MIPAIIKQREELREQEQRVDALERKNAGMQRRLDILISEMIAEKRERAILIENNDLNRLRLTQDVLARVLEGEAIMQSKLEFLEAKLGKVAQAADRRVGVTGPRMNERREQDWS